MGAKPVGSFYVQLGLNTEEFRRNLEWAQRDLRAAFGTAAIHASEVLAASIGAVGTALAALGVKAVKMAADLERQQVALTKLFGSAEKAAEKIIELQKFASVSGFDVEELIDYQKRLMAVGFNAEETAYLMQNMADAASALGLSGVGIDRLIKAFGDVRAKGSLQTQEMKQFAEVGIPVWDMLSKAMGKTRAELTKMVEARQISASDFLNAINSQMVEKWGGMMVEQSKTVTGAWNRMSNSIKVAIIDLGKYLTEKLPIKEILNSLTNFAQNVTKILKDKGLKGILDDFSREFPIIAQSVRTLAVNILSLLIPALSSVGSFLSMMLVPLAGIYTKILLIGVLFQDLAKIAGNSADEITGIVDGTTKNASEKIGGVGESAKKVFDTIDKDLNDSKDSYSEWLDDIADMFKTMWAGLVSGDKSLLAESFSVLKKYSNQAFAELKKNFLELRTYLEDSIDSFVNWVVELIVKAANGLGRTLFDIVEGFTNYLIDAIKNFGLNKFGSNLLHDVSDVAGFLGLDDASGKVKKLAQDLNYLKSFKLDWTDKKAPVFTIQGKNGKFELENARKELDQANLELYKAQENLEQTWVDIIASKENESRKATGALSEFKKLFDSVTDSALELKKVVFSGSKDQPFGNDPGTTKTNTKLDKKASKKFFDTLEPQINTDEIHFVGALLPYINETEKAAYELAFAFQGIPAAAVPALNATAEAAKANLEEIEKEKEELTALEQWVGGIWQNIGTTMNTVFENALLSSGNFFKSVGESLHKLGNQILAQIAQLAIMSVLFNALGIKTSAIPMGLQIFRHGGIVTGSYMGDGVVSDGKIITTHPDDYIIATKDPSSLGGKANVVVNVNNNSSSEVSTNSYFDGTREIIDIVINGISRNVSGSKDFFRSL